MEIFILACLAFISLVNLLCLFAIGIFLVRFRDRMNKIFVDFIGAMETMGAVPITLEKVEDRPKTWDEKYEEELDQMQKRIRANSGLQDLPSPGLSWGAPPALNNVEGLAIKDVNSTPMRVDRQK
jgi:hypothetical protein